MSSKPIKRSTHHNEEVSLSDSTSTRESEEKTIPFLRRLTDMLMENEEVISFEAGHRKTNGNLVLGKIVVHDRIKVEANVLPRYFNHSSFASLRRQLNYFNFTRIGKGRQRGATYTNEAVIELEDILNLKRKAATDATTSSLPTATNSSSTSKSSAGNALKKRTNSSSSQQKTSNKRLQITRDKTQPATKSTTSTSSNDTVVPTEISPISSFVSSDEERPSATEPRIALDLTISPGPKKHNFSTVPRPMTILHDASCRYPSIEGDGDADILAGCQALLNFAGFGNHHTAESKISSQ